MDLVTVERVDHVGIVAGVIKDVGLLEMINARLGLDDQEEITTGEAMAGMIRHGLGFSARPLSLPPPFCAHKPVGLLVRDGVSAEHWNRCKRGRSLDKAFAYGCDTWCSEIALAVCRQAGLACTCPCLDPTSVSLTGASVPETDTQAMAIPYGSATDHRPDVQHAVLAWRVGHEGGVPLRSQRGDGKASDTRVFTKRCEALLTPCAARETPRSLSADATCYPAAPAPNVARLPCLPRLPETFNVTQQGIEQAWAWGEWPPRHETVRSPRVELCPCGMAPRWRVVSSQDAWPRAGHTLATAQAHALEQAQKPLCPLQAHRCPSATDARAARETIAQGWRSPQRAEGSLTPPSQ